MFVPAPLHHLLPSVVRLTERQQAGPHAQRCQREILPARKPFLSNRFTVASPTSECQLFTSYYTCIPHFSNRVCPCQMLYRMTI